MIFIKIKTYMKTKEKEYTGIQKCRHCLNNISFEIIERCAVVTGSYEFAPNEHEDISTIVELLKCPACSKLSIWLYTWCDMIDDGSDITPEIIYPKTSDSDDIPPGLPDNINKALTAAHKVKSIDANAYAVLMGRVLEMICIDRKAKGKYLADQLQDLAEKGEIPNKLVTVAKSLKDLRNIGAHAALGELTREEIPILGSLCNAVLEYVYTAPYLVTQATEHLKKIRKS